ncbi:MAG: thioredoxin family protein [Chitinispirillaceae bacterium]|nr:thioredoxin family protein [Chitinispirillaceae bacterium]
MKKYLTAFTVFISILSIGCARQPVIVEEEDVQPQKAVTVRSDNFEQYITESTVAVIEFFSEKCAVCASLAWAIDSISTMFGDSVFVGANNTDKDTLYKKCSVPVVPTYVFYYKGEEKTRRSFTINDPYAFDTLVELLNSTMAGISDTGDTSTPIDTTPPDYLTLTYETFDSVVMRNGTTAMVFFLYSGGAPCIYMDSIIRQFAPAFENRAVIAKVEAWDEMELTDRYSIDFVPQYLFFKDSVYMENLKLTGTQPGDILVSVLEGLLGQNEASAP